MISGEMSGRTPKPSIDMKIPMSASSRQSRLYLSSKIISMIRNNNDDNTFSAQELLHLESILRDEFVKNQWLFNTCNAISDQSIVVNHQQIADAQKLQLEVESNEISEQNLKELRKKLDFLREKLSILQYQHKQLEIEKISMNCGKECDQTGLQAKNSDEKVRHNLQFKLKEMLDSVCEQSVDVEHESGVTEPKIVAQQIETALKSVENNDIESWFERQLDELSLNCCETDTVLSAFNSSYNEKLQKLKSGLIQMLSECKRIKNFYVNLKEDVSWREGFKKIINEIEKNNELSSRYQNTSYQLESLSSNKKSVIDMKFIESINNENIDEIQSLMNALKERVEILQLNM